MVKVDKSKWKSKTLGEICTCAGTYGAPSPSIAKDSSRPRYIRITDIDNWGKLNDDYVVSANKEDDEKYSLVYGDILFARTGATVGKTYLYESLEPQIYAGYLIRFRLNTDIVNSKYVFLFSKSSTYKSWLKNQMIGAAQPNINAKKYSSLILPIPSLNIQLTIATELDTLQSLINQYREQLNDYDKLAQSIFHEMFGDVEVNKNKWKYVSLKEICEIGDGLHGTPDYDNDGKVPFINGNNLRNGKIIIDNRTKHVSSETYRKYYIQMNDNTILMSINGTIGNLAFYEGQSIMLGKSAAYFIIKDKNIIKTYLYYILGSQNAMDYYKKSVTGLTINNLGLKALRSFSIPLPPLPLQQQFASRIESIEAQKALIKQQLSDVQTLFDSRMQYYFD